MATRIPFRIYRVKRDQKTGQVQPLVQPSSRFVQGKTADDIETLASGEQMENDRAHVVVGPCPLIPYPRPAPDRRRRAVSGSLRGYFWIGLSVSGSSSGTLTIGPKLANFASG